MAKKYIKANNFKKLTLSALFLALGLVLPLLTGQIKEIGNMLLPMHIPVFLCGMICGWEYGLVVGFATPILRSFAFGMPSLYPQAVRMACELATYGSVSGLIYSFNKKKILHIYISLIIAMLLGRIVWAMVTQVLFGISGGKLTFSFFLTTAFVNGLPGIIIQLVIIPLILIFYNTYYNN